MTVVAPDPAADLELADAAALSPDEVLARLGSRPDGLTAGEVAERLARYGDNSFGTHKVRPTAVLIRQVRNPILLLLLGAALVSGLTGGGTNAVIITVIVALSVGLGFFNEYRAEMAMASLRAKIRQEAEVHRDGRTSRVPVTDLVPGDVVTLRLGGLVPADLRLIEVDELECDEGVLTGESLPVAKSVAPDVGREPQDQPGCAFMGTIVHQGSGLGVVVRTGNRTAFGQIAAGLSERHNQTAFEVGLAHFSRFLFIVAAVLTSCIFIINVALARPLIDALLFSLAIAVGIAPEMMPAIVTVSLSTGSKALTAKKVLVKRLVAIEDLGNIEILFTDKTGTLTEGRITFERALAADGTESGRALLLGLVCNEASVTADGPVGGNALDQALWSAPGAAANGPVAVEAATYRRVGMLPFDHERQLASVVAEDPAGTALLVTKGAPEVVLDRCVHVPEAAKGTLEALFNEGARVVAVASRPATAAQAPAAADEQGLVFEGFLTFADRPKADAGSSIALLEGLGIEVKVITGDNGLVAAKVCTDIGLVCTGVLSGTDVAALDDGQLEAAIATTTIFARIGPDQKSRIITAARRTGKDVAFLGDGVNDAVALHHADVGISVDSGTDVAKDAADVVLLDKDLGVLADGVMEGRRIFANTMKYVLMATSSNFGNMFSAAGASIFLTFLPMLPSQILLNNLLYNAGQLVIPTDRVDPEVLTRPAAWDMKFIRRFMSVFGPVSSIFDYGTFGVMLWILHAGHVEFRSGWFVESILTQTLVIYVIRTRRIPFVRSRPSIAMLTVPTGAALIGAVLPFTGLAHLLGFKPLPATFFLWLFAMVVVYLVMVELAKVPFYHPRQPPVPRPAPTHAERLERAMRRRASRYVRHPGQRPGRSLPRGRVSAPERVRRPVVQIADYACAATASGRCSVRDDNRRRGEPVNPGEWAARLAFDRRWRYRPLRSPVDRRSAASWPRPRRSARNLLVRSLWPECDHRPSSATSLPQRMTQMGVKSARRSVATASVVLVASLVFVAACSSGPETEPSTSAPRPVAPTSTSSPMTTVTVPGGGYKEALGTNSPAAGDCTTNTSEAATPVGFVVLKLTTSSFQAEIHLQAGAPNTKYSVLMQQVPGSCPQSGPNGGTFTTGSTGRGHASATVPRVPGATTFYVQLVSAGSGPAQFTSDRVSGVS